MRKHILCSVAFLAILIVLLAAASLVFQPKNNTYAAGMYDPEANGILAEPENTIDVLFLGDSEAYCAFIPLKIWQDYGITSYVCGTSDQKLYQTGEFLQNAFRNQNPKIVVLETNIFYRDYGRTDATPQAAEELLPIFRYHDRWKSLQPEDWFSPVRYTGIQRNKGYYFSQDANPADTTGYMERTEATEAVPSKNIRYIEEISTFCREHNARLILVSTPSTINWSGMRHNSVAALSERLGVTYIDMNLLQEEIPIDWKTDTLDRGDHMNYSGAQKISDYLGAYFAETALFEDKRTWAEYDGWNQMLDSFLKEVKSAPDTKNA